MPKVKVVRRAATQEQDTPVRLLGELDALAHAAVQARARRHPFALDARAPLSTTPPITSQPRRASDRRRF